MCRRRFTAKLAVIPSAGGASMKVLLTASSGNVGSHVLRELLRRGHTVRTFTQGAGQLHAGKRFRATSPDPAAVAGAVESADVVIHRAQDRVQRLVRDSGLIWAIFRLADVRSSASAPRT
jgi:putative NADH-flavin reductase